MLKKALVLQLRFSLLFFPVLLVLGLIFTWRWYFMNPPAQASEFKTLVGTVRSVEEWGRHENPILLEIYLHEMPLRFFVSLGGYNKSWDRKPFLAQVKSGTKIYLTMRKEDFVTPDLPRFDPYPTVFVYGVKTATKTYIPLEKYLTWDKHNNRLGLFTVILLTFLAPLSVFLYKRYSPQMIANYENRVFQRTAKN